MEEAYGYPSSHQFKRSPPKYSSITIITDGAKTENGSSIKDKRLKISREQILP
jgi:hypothetical protein